MSSVKLVSVTEPKIDGVKTAEDLVVYCARVSNPVSQESGENPERLLNYCIRKGHWSVFEMAGMTLEITAPRDVTRQIIRHYSFRYQEFSQRYAVVDDFELRECRLQDLYNRQNSIECMDTVKAKWWAEQQQTIVSEVKWAYMQAIDKGIAKEVARAILPEGLTMSRLYMHGTLRSWIHYFQVRREAGTQKEHREVAEAAWVIFAEQFPTIARAVEGV